MEQLTLPAPAKINLFLNILGRRADGYHELQTVFQLIDFCDTLMIELTEGDLSVETKGMKIAETENIVYRAATRLRDHGKTRLGAHIRLEKHIPSGAGLGGGSSDAATALHALNLLWQLDLPEADLIRLGTRLGADVPLFIKGRSAWAEGIGERLQPVDLPEKWFLVIYPGCSVPTAQVFLHPDLTRQGTAITIARFFEQGSGPNACESLVRRLFPPVDEAVRWLSQWGPARMTGSGSCVFLGLDTEQAARDIAAKVPRKWKGIVAKGVAESPLLQAMSQTRLS